MIEKRVFGPISHGLPATCLRADLEIYRINHFRPSYTALVFFNDTKVTTKNANKKRESYAGMFSIFGHSECAGDDDHCEQELTFRRFDDRPSHHLTKAFMRVIVTECLKKVIGAGDKLTITVVATSKDDNEIHGDHLFECEGMQIVTFD